MRLPRSSDVFLADGGATACKTRIWSPKGGRCADSKLQSRTSGQTALTSPPSIAPFPDGRPSPSPGPRSVPAFAIRPHRSAGFAAPERSAAGADSRASGPSAEIPNPASALRALLFPPKSRDAVPPPAAMNWRGGFLRGRWRIARPGGRRVFRAGRIGIRRGIFLIAPEPRAEASHSIARALIGQSEGPPAKIARRGNMPNGLTQKVSMIDIGGERKRPRRGGAFAEVNFSYVNR
jgi:hypothetical protein